MSQYGDNIRTIAKTKELSDKADKAQRTADEALKEAINAERVAALQTNTGTNTSITGASTAEVKAIEEKLGVDANGNPVASEIPPIKPPKLTEYVPSPPTDDKVGKDDQNNIANDPTPDKGDLSNNVQPIGTSGSELVDLASGDSLIPGIFEVGSLYDGLTGPKISDPVSPIGGLDALGNYVISTGGEIMKALVGFDPVDDTIAVLINFLNNPTFPSLEDSENSGQNPWTSTIPPVYEGFLSGYIWSVSGPSLAAASTAEGAMFAWKAHVEDLGFLNVLAYDLELTSGTPTVPIAYKFHLTYQDNFTTFDAPNTVIGRYSESSNPDASSGTAPSYSWPLTNSYVLAYYAAVQLFKSDPANTEAPPSTIPGLSTVQIKSNVTDDVYNVTVGVNNGVLISKDVDPPYALYYDKNMLLRDVLPTAHLPFYTAR